MAEKSLRTLRIKTDDGRVFAGSPVSVVQQMQAISFTQLPSVEDYIRWSCETARSFLGVELDVAGDTPEDLAASFLDAAIAADLAVQI